MAEESVNSTRRANRGGRRRGKVQTQRSSLALWLGTCPRASRGNRKCHARELRQGINNTSFFLLHLLLSSLHSNTSTRWYSQAAALLLTHRVLPLRHPHRLLHLERACTTPPQHPYH